MLAEVVDGVGAVGTDDAEGEVGGLGDDDGAVAERGFGGESDDGFGGGAGRGGGGHAFEVEGGAGDGAEEFDAVDGVFVGIGDGHIDGAHEVSEDHLHGVGGGGYVFAASDEQVGGGAAGALVGLDAEGVGGGSGVVGIAGGEGCGGVARIPEEFVAGEGGAVVVEREVVGIAVVGAVDGEADAVAGVEEELRDAGDGGSDGEAAGCGGGGGIVPGARYEQENGEKAEGAWDSHKADYKVFVCYKYTTFQNIGKRLRRINFIKNQGSYGAGRRTGRYGGGVRSDYFTNYKHVAHRFTETGAPAEAGCAAITHSDMQIAHYGRDGCILRPRRAAQGPFPGDGFRHRWRVRTQRSHPTACRPRHRGSELRRKVAQRTSNGRIGEAAEPHRRQARPITEDEQRSFQDFENRARRTDPEAFAHKALHARQGCSAPLSRTGCDGAAL